MRSDALYFDSHVPNSERTAVSPSSKRVIRSSDSVRVVIEYIL